MFIFDKHVSCYTSVKLDLIRARLPTPISNLPGSTKVFISHNTRLMLDIGSCNSDIVL
jgi:hypothetical protein